jgi:hypothetical protein
MPKMPSLLDIQIFAQRSPKKKIDTTRMKKLEAATAVPEFFPSEEHAC